MGYLGIFYSESGEFMFDPTAFDNQKVIVEGAVYDRDFDGEIEVVNREDIVNLANLSRSFQIEFKLKNNAALHDVVGGIKMVATIENLSAELLTNQLNEKLTGSTIEVFLRINEEVKEESAGYIIQSLEKIWGKDRHIYWVKEGTISNRNSVSNRSSFIISFERLVLEEQMDDLIEMLDYIIQSINMIEEL